MFTRLTVRTLLQSTLLALATMAVVPLSARVWDSWSAFNASGRIVAAADASADAFQAMINIRSDRSSTPRISARKVLTGVLRAPASKAVSTSAGSLS